MLSHKKQQTASKTVFKVSSNRYFAAINTCSKTKFIGTFNSEKEAYMAARTALNGKKSKKLVCYY
tara:strand:- start:1046 stop:1240 length:195 start_codon:yes stop_codon:yes gene_type:complete